MRSIRTKIIALTLGAIIISVLSFGITGIFAIMEESNQTSARILNLVCENRKNLLDKYLDSIQQSVNMISHLSVDELDSVARRRAGCWARPGQAFRSCPTAATGSARRWTAILTSIWP